MINLTHVLFHELSWSLFCRIKTPMSKFINSSTRNSMIHLKMGCTIPIENGWSIFFVFCKTRIISFQHNGRYSSSCSKFYLGFFTIVPHSPTSLSFSFKIASFVNRSLVKIPLRCTTKHKKEVVLIKVIYFNPNQY
jgi:hypothetical protein